MSKRDTQPKIAPSAIRVETASTVQGRAATTISVEVDEPQLGQPEAEANRADRAIAMVPRTHDGKQEWKEEELIHSGRRITKDDRVVKTFNATVSGPVSAHEAGVAVKVETPAGTVWANEENARLATREADKELPTKRQS
jgi:hypothetical protein